MRWNLVTGGALRLGAEICRALAKKGKNVVIHFRKSEREAKQLQEELIGYGVVAEILMGDFSTEENTKAFLASYRDRFAQTEGLVNNVGNYALGPASTISSHELTLLLQVNTIAPLMLIQGVLSALKNLKGSVVNIGMAGTSHAMANIHATAYNMTKLSLTMLTKSLAKELAPFSISVNMVSPGYLEDSVDYPSHAQTIPAGRLAQFQEVAQAVVFFMSKESAYITGQNLEVAGGVRL
ncbi:MAG TPA: SDR family oxidoreductase [Rhabdochlamydiaceae bacterium]|jgi:NAD(P)-dependent dehydrogenase (short-subunit alcohol dehydrogenase family)